MYELRVSDRIYQIKFGYGVLYKTDLIDRVMTAVTMDEDENPSDLIKRLIGMTSELLLAGLQRRHKDEFGYETSDEREAMILKVCDLIDDYEDEHKNDDPPKNGFTLFTELQRELESNGFLSQITAEAMETAAEQDATVIPRDHQKKQKAGANK